MILQTPEDQARELVYDLRSDVTAAAADLEKAQHRLRIAIDLAVKAGYLE